MSIEERGELLDVLCPFCHQAIHGRFQVGKGHSCPHTEVCGYTFYVVQDGSDLRTTAHPEDFPRQKFAEEVIQ
jgi:hypothetical protein